MKVRILVPAIVASALAAATANATPQLQLALTQVSSSTAIVDTAHTGMAAFSGTVGKFSVPYASGLGDPVLTQPDEYQIDLSAQVVATQAGTLKIALTEANLIRPVGSLGFNESFGGTIPKGWTISVDAYFDADNVAFGMADALFSYSFTAPAGSPTSAFSVEANSSGLVSAGPFSITDVVTITATDKGQPASFDLTSTDVPEPDSVASFGAGLLSLGLVLRRRKNRRNA